MKHKMTRPNKFRPISMNLDQSPNLNKSPLISIVITSYTMERFKDICELLDSIKSQTLLNRIQSAQQIIEVILVAEQSRELYEDVKEYGNKVGLPNFKVLFSEEELGLSAARNLGIKEAKGDIIAFVDDDAVLFPEWAEEMVKTYDDESIIGVTGPAILMGQDKSVEKWLPDEFTWIVGGTSWMKYEGSDVFDIRNVGGMNYSFRKRCFEEYGFHNPQLGCWGGEAVNWGKLSGEEVELSLRMRRSGKRIVFNPKVKVYHKMSKRREKLSYLAKRAYRTGYARHFIKKLYSTDYGNFLSTERKVLNQIFGKLLPQILFRDLPSSPRIALRKFLVTFAGTFSIGLGYLVYWIKPYKGIKSK